MLQKLQKECIKNLQNVKIRVVFHIFIIFLYFDNLDKIWEAEIFEYSGNSYSCDNKPSGFDDLGACAKFQSYQLTEFSAPQSSINTSALDDIDGMSGFTEFQEITDYFKTYSQNTINECRRGVRFCNKDEFFNKLDQVMNSNLLESGGSECSCNNLISSSSTCGYDFYDYESQCTELAQFASIAIPTGIAGADVVEKVGMFDMETILSMNTDQLFGDIEEHTRGNIPWHYEQINTIAGTEQTRPQMMEDIRRGQYAAAEFQKCQDNYANNGAQDLTTVDKVKDNFQAFRTFLTCIRNINPNNHP